jgi:DNA-binding PadR family transcriptional regulator
MADAPLDPPLPPATFFVLFALAGGDKHGYAIMKEARELSEQRFQMGPATLYTTIQRLSDYGWISQVTSAKGDDPRRRYYRLTPAGRNAVQEELRRMEALVRKSKAMRLRPAESAS